MFHSLPAINLQLGWNSQFMSFNCAHQIFKNVKKTATECGIVLETLSFMCGNKLGVNGTDVLGILGTVACLIMEHLNSCNYTCWSPSMMLMSCWVRVFLLCRKMQIIVVCLTSLTAGALLWLCFPLLSLLIGLYFHCVAHSFAFLLFKSVSKRQPRMAVGFKSMHLVWHMTRGCVFKSGSEQTVIMKATSLDFGVRTCRANLFCHLHT